MSIPDTTAKVPFVHSNYERRPDDDYQTIDARCVQALVDTWPVKGAIVDCCAPNGSGIIYALHRLGHLTACCAASVDSAPAADWIVTNPPYLRDVVDRIASGILSEVRSERSTGAALLMRANWDFAARRADLFADPLYRGQTRMRFRPWWSEDRKAQPIHNYVWHVWTLGEGEPVIRYWSPPCVRSAA
jgi:hypothetical protein